MRAFDCFQWMSFLTAIKSPLKSKNYNFSKFTRQDSISNLLFYLALWEWPDVVRFNVQVSLENCNFCMRFLLLNTGESNQPPKAYIFITPYNSMARVTLTRIPAHTHLHTFLELHSFPRHTHTRFANHAHQGSESDIRNSTRIGFGLTFSTIFLISDNLDQIRNYPNFEFG